MSFLSKKPSAAKVPDFSPGDISEDATRQYFELNSRSAIERNRWFVVSLILSLALVAAGAGFYTLIPLKTIEVVQVGKMDGGRLAVDPTPVGKWEPDNDSIGYFLNKWVATVVEVNRATIDESLKESMVFVVDQAKDQLRDLRMRDNPIASLTKSPSYSRMYEFKGINFYNKNVALIRYKTTTRMNGEVKEGVYLITITFTRVKPDSIEKVMKNPAGLYITNFNITEEATK